MNYAILGIYPPFLLSPGTKLTKAMEITGVSADIILREVLKDKKEIKIPYKFITKVHEGHSFYHENSTSKHHYVIVKNGNDLLIRGRGLGGDEGMEHEGADICGEDDGDGGGDTGDRGEGEKYREHDGDENTDVNMEININGEEFIKGN